MLSLSDAIINHRKMWAALRNAPNLRTYQARTEYKQAYLASQEHLGILNSCYLCQYAAEQTKNGPEGAYCNNCIADWCSSCAEKGSCNCTNWVPCECNQRDEEDKVCGISWAYSDASEVANIPVKCSYTIKMEKEEYTKTIQDFYDEVAKKACMLGNFNYDCTKILVAHNIADAIIGTYKATQGIAMYWCMYGPKTDESLNDGEVCILPGFFVTIK